MSRARKLRQTTLPPAQVTDDWFHYTINHHVRIGFKGAPGASIAYTDTLWRAQLVADALNAYRRTPAGKRWWRRVLGHGKLPQAARCERCGDSPCRCRWDERRDWSLDRYREEIADLTRTLKAREEAAQT